MQRRRTNLRAHGSIYAQRHYIWKTYRIGFPSWRLWRNLNIKKRQRSGYAPNVFAKNRTGFLTFQKHPPSNVSTLVSVSRNKSRQNLNLKSWHYNHLARTGTSLWPTTRVCAQSFIPWQISEQRDPVQADTLIEGGHRLIAAAGPTYMVSYTCMKRCGMQRRHLNMIHLISAMCGRALPEVVFGFLCFFEQKKLMKVCWGRGSSTYHFADPISDRMSTILASGSTSFQSIT